eukprot:CAMPEP_0119154732 /NCGR_PEP_ID=MMETSP1310-20130426/51213_1 /TAXON_ID=464262 /ORGANISM="Genus nov. species nov., Strain RCC2339" /LENGTH=77 /DNA_ID=CAMNT_0007147285 /DNA_START=89 /DNA_END=318 /DNA_ORIENTATION=+
MATQKKLARRLARNSTRDLGEAERNELRRLFDRMDLDHSGTISNSELHKAMGNVMGCDLDERNAALMMRRVDTDMSG